jgi:hypothetical protein
MSTFFDKHGRTWAFPRGVREVRRGLKPAENTAYREKGHFHNILTAGGRSDKKNNVVLLQLFIQSGFFPVDKTGDGLTPSQADGFIYFFQPGTVCDLQIDSGVGIVRINFAMTVQSAEELYFYRDGCFGSEHPECLAHLDLNFNTSGEVAGADKADHSARIRYAGKGQ